MKKLCVCVSDRVSSSNLESFSETATRGDGRSPGCTSLLQVFASESAHIYVISNEHVKIYARYGSLKNKIYAISSVFAQIYVRCKGIK